MRTKENKDMGVIIATIIKSGAIATEDLARGSLRRPRTSPSCPPRSSRHSPAWNEAAPVARSRPEGGPGSLLEPVHLSRAALRDDPEPLPGHQGPAGAQGPARVAAYSSSTRPGRSSGPWAGKPGQPQKLLAANKRLNTAYHLKESFDRLWTYKSEAWMRNSSITGGTP